MANTCKVEIRTVEDGTVFVAHGEMISDFPRPLIRPGWQVVDAKAQVELTPEGTIKYSVSAVLKSPAVEEAPTIEAHAEVPTEEAKTGEADGN